MREDYIWRTLEKTLKVHVDIHKAWTVIYRTTGSYSCYDLKKFMFLAKLKEIK